MEPCNVYFSIGKINEQVKSPVANSRERHINKGVYVIKMENEEVKQYLINFVEKTLNECKVFTKVYGKEFVRERLEKNLNKVIIKYSEIVNKNLYDMNNSNITIFLNTDSAKNLTISDIENNKKLKHNILHEAVHVIFRRTKEECEAIGIESGTGTLEFDHNGGELGRGLNEGLTEWICQKAGYGMAAYTAEINVIRMLELAIGEETVMQLAKGDIKGNIAQLLQITKQECLYCMALVDNIYQNERKANLIEGTIEDIEDSVLDKSISHFEATIFEKYFGEEIAKAQNEKNISAETMECLFDLCRSINGGKTSASNIFNSRLPFKFKNEIYPELIRKHQETLLAQMKEDKLAKNEEEKTDLPVVYKKNWFHKIKELIKERFMKKHSQNTLINQETKIEKREFKKYISEMSNYSETPIIRPTKTNIERAEEIKDFDKQDLIE